MTPEDIKAAYHAQRYIQNLDEEAERVREMERWISSTDSYRYYSEAYKEYLHRDYANKIRRYDERIQEQQKVIDPVLQWADTCPELIRKIIVSRVVYLQSWEEISQTLLKSQVPNAAYMRLKRYMATQN